MRPYRIPSFRAEVRMLYENEEKSQHDTEWRIYYADDILPFSSPRQQILLRWYPKQWANSVSYFQSFVSDPQLTANGSQLSAIIPFPKD